MVACSTAAGSLALFFPARHRYCLLYTNLCRTVVEDTRGGGVECLRPIRDTSYYRPLLLLLLLVLFLRRWHCCLRR